MAPPRALRAGALLLLCAAALLPAPSRARLMGGMKQQTSPPPPEASLAVFTAEGNALIELRKALNNHPAFAGLNITDSNPATKGLTKAEWGFINEGNVPAWRHTPCGPAQWAWVGCSATGRVVSLKLNGGEMSKVNSSWQYNNVAPLMGIIPWEKLQVLSELTYFDVGLQSVEGDLIGMGVFPNLENFTISWNRFSGPVPEEVTKLTKLKGFQAQENQLSGSLPSSMSTMTNLAALVLSDNTLAGSYPAWLANIQNLKTLDLSANQLSGPLPDSWSQLSKLGILQLGTTVVSGEVPASWTAMTTLKHISMVQMGLRTTYPAAFTAMTNLQSIALGQNNLYGPLPTSIFTAKLTELTLDNNFFNGTLPDPATTPTANDQLLFKYDGNCLGNLTDSPQRPADNCTSFYTELYAGPASTTVVTGNNAAVIVVSILVPLFAIIAMTIGALFYLRSRRRNRHSKLFTKGLRQTSQEFTLSDLKAATQNWGAAIGKGGYGTVYKAELKDGSFVAVKRLDQVSKQGDMEFIREVELLSRVHHRHLVNLVGFCAERGERALVYEYMAMGSLYEHLHGDSAKAFPLSWDSRCKIAIHVALGIEYLHYGADPPLIHRDIKSANILLSDDGYSKVADFGLCKEAPVGAAADGSEQLVPTATAVRGSFGYLDPEYVNTSILSEKSDVYSYGVVLLELISGHKSIHDWQPLAYWAEEYLADREKTPLMVDPVLEGNFDLDELYALCDIARTCVQDQSANRPTIRDVAKALVENLGHGLTSFTGSQQDSASIVASSQTDASSIPSTTYTPSSDPPSAEYSYQNYSETLHWTPNTSGQMDKSGNGLTVSTGTKGDRLPVPVPKRPDGPRDEEMGKK